MYTWFNRYTGMLKNNFLNQLEVKIRIMMQWFIALTCNSEKLFFSLSSVIDFPKG